MKLDYAQVVPDLRRLAKVGQLGGRKHVVTSGGFDPMHVGHIRCILHTVQIAREMDALVTVIVNGDGFLERKKGEPFMMEADRVELVSALRGVDFVTVWDDKSPTVIGALELLKPTVFTKGGDWDSPETLPEWDICQALNIKVMFGVGGEKIRSSSELIRKATG